MIFHHMYFRISNQCFYKYNVCKNKLCTKLSSFLSTVTRQTIQWTFPFEKTLKGIFILAEICLRPS